MKEQDKIAEQVNKEGLCHLLEKEFRVMIVKIVKTSEIRLRKFKKKIQI